MHCQILVHAINCVFVFCLFVCLCACLCVYCIGWWSAECECKRLRSSTCLQHSGRDKDFGLTEVSSLKCVVCCYYSSYWLWILHKNFVIVDIIAIPQPATSQVVVLQLLYWCTKAS